jgi:hypothetical protein
MCKLMQFIEGAGLLMAMHNRSLPFMVQVQSDTHVLLV